MDILWTYGIPFLIVLTPLVFVHELGHYLVARMCGVRVEVFSIGFGPEIFGWNDRTGTRWKFAAIPFGGYVRMYGEQAPLEGDEQDEKMPEPSDEEKKFCFYAKTVRQRSWIVTAGPVANFLFAIVILAALFSIVGQPFTPPDIDTVVEGSAAERAGFKPGDVFKRIGSTEIERFEQVQQMVQVAPGKELQIIVLRGGREKALTVIPDSVELTRFGTVQTVAKLGVTRKSGDTILVRHNPLTATWVATRYTAKRTLDILDAIVQIVSGNRPVEELGGPIRIAQISVDIFRIDPINLFRIGAILSINLGLINLFPIPMLDGGHLFFYLIEPVLGRPMGERAMGYSLNFGLALILGLMLFVTWNDLVQLGVVEYFIDLAT